MTSSSRDMKTPDFARAARALFAELNRVTGAFGRDDQIPDDAKWLVKEMASTLDAAHPNERMASVDPSLRSSLLGTLVLCKDALDSGSRRALRLHLEQFRQLLRDVVDERPVHPDRDAREIARWLVDTVGLPQRELAETIGVAPRTFQRWIAETNPAVPSAEDQQRLRAAAATVAHLRHSFTAPGVISWLNRPHPLLADRPPAALLSDPEAYPRLVALASGSRSTAAG
jgi:uncharacterized protein (DUF2384 family)